MPSRTTLYYFIRNQALHKPVAGLGVRHFHPTMATDTRASLKPAARVAGRKQDVWYVLSLALFVTTYLLHLHMPGSGFAGEGEGRGDSWGTSKQTMDGFLNPSPIFYLI
jgi:hypothetical protein